jgi:hypothetical protein
MFPFNSQDVYEQKQAAGDQEAQSVIKSISPVAGKTSIYSEVLNSTRQRQKSTLMLWSLDMPIRLTGARF